MKYLNIVNCLLFLMFIFGLSLRLIKIPGMWIGDSATDYTIANHIVNFHEFPLKGPHPSAFPLPYSPVWYWFLALILIVNSKLTFLISVFAVLHSLSIITIYKIAKLLFNSGKTALLSAFFFATSSSEIYFSRNVWGNHVSIPFFLLSFFFFVKYLRTKEFFYLFFSIINILFISLFNYANLPFVLLYALFIYLRTGKIRIILKYLFIFGILFAAMHFHLLYSLDSFAFKQSSGSGTFYPASVIRNIYLFLESVFPVSPQLINFAIFGLVILVIFNFKFKKLMLPVSFITLNILAGSFISSKCCYTYYTSVYPFFFLIVAYLIFASWQKFKLWKKFLMVLFIIFFTRLFTADYKAMYARHDQYGLYSQVSEVIISDARANPRIFNNFNTVFINDKDTVDSPIFWYFQEKGLKRRFAQVSAVRLNLQMVVRPAYLYLVCPDLEWSICRKIFPAEYPAYRLIKKFPNLDKYTIILYSTKISR